VKKMMLQIRVKQFILNPALLAGGMLLPGQTTETLIMDFGLMIKR
jgi:hypothetical protein